MNKEHQKTGKAYKPKKHYNGGHKSRAPAAPREKGGVRIQADIWGTHAVSAALKNPQRKIKKIYVTQTMIPSLTEMLEGLSHTIKIEPVIVDKKQLDHALKNAVHQGIALDAEPLAEVFVSDLIAKSTQEERSVIIMLDQVTDPHNVGAILRSACAFGASGMIMQRKHSPSLTGVLAKTATGAVEHIPVAYEINLSDTLDKLTAAGFTAIGLDERGEKTIGEVKTDGHTVLVLGAEGSGLRPKVREHCTTLARLPTSGDIASLNVSNAAAVALYALQ